MNYETKHTARAERAYFEAMRTDDAKKRLRLLWECMEHAAGVRGAYIQALWLVAENEAVKIEDSLRANKIYA